MSASQADRETSREKRKGEKQMTQTSNHIPENDATRDLTRAENRRHLDVKALPLEEQGIVAEHKAWMAHCRATGRNPNSI